ncbi:MAG: PAS domain-containing protein [Lentisphaerae bacterium]|nr:PAS domain-containing protein [Lentisphaerota bacterium]
MTNLFIIGLPVVITINLLLGMIVFLTNMGRLANRVFVLLSLVFALWLACQYFGSIAVSEAWLEFWIRQACATSVLIPLLFHLLRAAAVQPSTTLASLLRRAWPWAAAVVGAAVLSQTRFFLVGARLSIGGNAIGEPLYGPGFTLFVAFWLVAVVALVWSFFRALARAEGVYRMEMQIMAYGSLFSFVPGVVLVLLIPLFTESSQSARFTPITVVIWHSAMAYGIATRHIMGVGEFLRRGIIWSLVACALAIMYYAVFRLVMRLPSYGADELQHHMAHVCAGIVIALSLAPANAFLRSRADYLFEKDHDALSQLVRRGGDLARSITTVDALCTDFSRLLQHALGVSRMQVYLQDGSRFVPHPVPGEEAAEPVGEADPLVQALRAERYPLIRDVLRRGGNTPLEVRAERVLARLDVEVAVALKSKNGLAGFLLLGRRANGRVFGQREEDALAFLGDQLGFAIENATLYTRLQDARLYNEVLLDNLVTGVVAVGADGHVTVCNREAQRILRLAPDGEVIGRSAADVLPEPVWNDLRACLFLGRGVRDQDMRLYPQSPREQAVRLSTAVFGGNAGASTGALLVIQDTSAIRKLEEQIRRSDRLASIGTMAAGMAHEIKNPLVGLKTFIQLLPDHYEDPDFRNTFVPLLGNEVERINAIVSQLLNFSRPVKPTLNPLALHATLDAARTLVAQQIKARGLVFERHYEAENDRLLGDQGLLSQLFINLFLNGMDAMEPGGTLTVTTQAVRRPDPRWAHAGTPAEAWIEVRVQDTGRGISPEDKPQIFDPFFTTKATGTGLGLSVAHGIVIEHRGMIDVESIPGAGACFRVLLPLLAGGDPIGDTESKGEA